MLPNESELAALTGIADPAPAGAALRRRSGGPVLATLGERGALLVAAPDASARPYAARAVRVVDTAGAGDAFAGAFAAALASGARPGDAVAFALVGAALAMPTRAEILALAAGT